MGMILPFRRPDARGSRAPVRRAELRRVSGDVIIFPGVRIEREAPVPPKTTLEGGKRRKAGAGRKN